MMNNKILILLATYNGEKYVSTQLDSILNQSYPNWELYISDDGSSDDTVSIIEEYSKRDSRIRIINEELKQQGACQNFGNSLQTSLDDEWDFLMFADQDDFWFSDKIQRTLDMMLHNDDYKMMPMLVYTNFEYADDNLTPLPQETTRNTSVWKKPNMSRILVQNNIYGCTMMINRLLAEKASPVPICSENHDYWISLVAMSLGNIVHLKECTMLYRQHSNNVSGHYTNNTFSNRLRRFSGSWKKMEYTLLSSHKQVFELCHRYGNEMVYERNIFLKKYCRLIEKKSLYLLLFCYNNGIRRNTVAQNIMLHFLLLKFLIMPNKNQS